MTSEQRALERWRSREEWRIICPCQYHRPRRRIRPSAPALTQLTRRAGAFLVGAPLLLGVFALPLDDPPPSASTTPRVAVATMVPQTLSAVPAPPPEPPKPQKLRLITRKVREDFLAPARKPDQLTFDVVAEEFFRSEIPFGSLIYTESKRQGVAPELVAAVVDTESDFRPDLVSRKNALGLMQIVPSTGALMGATNLMDPVDNLRTGIRYLKYLNKRFGGDGELVLAAYNAGEGNVRKFGGIPPFRETQDYVQKVRRRNEEYRRRIERRARNASIRPLRDDGEISLASEKGTEDARPEHPDAVEPGLTTAAADPAAPAGTPSDIEAERAAVTSDGTAPEAGPGSEG